MVATWNWSSLTSSAMTWAAAPLCSFLLSWLLILTMSASLWVKSSFKKRNHLIICCNGCGQMLDFLLNRLVTLLVYFTWLRAEPCMTTAGLTASGGTGNTVTIIHSGLANLGSMPKMTSSSSEMRLKISCTRSGLSRIFFSCESSFTCFHSAYSSRPERLIRGW